MIVLPDTPPSPKTWKLGTSTQFFSQLSALRSSLDASAPSTYSDSVRLVAQLEEYLEGIFQLLLSEENISELKGATAFSLSLVVCKSIPWENVISTLEKKNELKLRSNNAENCLWTLACEIETVITAISFAYTRLGAEITNELCESDSQDVQTDDKWKLVTNFYKKAIAMAYFGSEFAQHASTPLLDSRVFILLDSIGNIGIQTSILCKFSTLNRNLYNDQDKFTDGNNAVLCRVAIWILDEIKKCQRLSSEMTPTGDLMVPKTDKWDQYFKLFSRYASAYAGLFLSIEYYQKGQLGMAIGLTNFSLLSLQSKKLNTDYKRNKIMVRFKEKFRGKKNEHYISRLQSTTTLCCDKSVFQALLGIVLSDVALLFDLLVQCRLKYTKENDNLTFDDVVDWQDIHSDSKWPIGCKIPVSTVNSFTPKALQKEPPDGLKSNFTGRGSYY